MGLGEFFKKPTSILTIILIILTIPAFFPFIPYFFALYWLGPAGLISKVLGGLTVWLRFRIIAFTFSVIMIAILATAAYGIFKLLKKLEIKPNLFWIYFVWIFYLVIVLLTILLLRFYI